MLDIPMAAPQQPSFTAYNVTKRGDGQDDWWTPIGAALPHKDGDGFNIVLQTIPLDGKCLRAGWNRKPVGRLPELVGPKD